MSIDGALDWHLVWDRLQDSQYPVGMMDEINVGTW